VDDRYGADVEEDESLLIPIPPLNVAPTPISSDELIRGGRDEHVQDDLSTVIVPSTTLTTVALPQTSPQLVLQPDTSLPPFIAPKFTRDAEMEFRRRVRMRARFPMANNNNNPSGNTTTDSGIPPHAIGGRPVPLTFADLSDMESGSSGSGGGPSIEGEPEEGEDEDEEADNGAEFSAA